MTEYDKDTFVLTEPPVESTSTEPTQVEQVQPDPEQVQTEPEVTPSAEPVKDNDVVRYEYWQSEAMKAKNRLAELEKKLEPPPKEDLPPALPQDATDPMEVIRYNTELSNYTLRQIKKIQDQTNQTESQRQETEKAYALKQYTVAKLTEVNKSPQKSQNIVNFFANSPHLQNPAVYDVMYDAAMNFLNKKSPENSTRIAPPPPINGESGNVRKSIDDMFNEQIMEHKKYRL